MEVGGGKENGDGVQWRCRQVRERVYRFAGKNGDDGGDDFSIDYGWKWWKDGIFDEEEGIFN